MSKEIVLNGLSHTPNLEIRDIEVFYSKKDGVEVSYVCSSDLNGEGFSYDIFYRKTPHPKYGNRYFGLFVKPGNGIFITNADRVEDFVFNMILDKKGVFHYSSHRHDLKVIGNLMIDGGRSYTRTNSKTHSFSVKDGKFIPIG